MSRAYYSHASSTIQYGPHSHHYDNRERHYGNGYRGRPHYENYEDRERPYDSGHGGRQHFEDYDNRERRRRLSHGRGQSYEHRESDYGSGYGAGQYHESTSRPYTDDYNDRHAQDDARYRQEASKKRGRDNDSEDWDAPDRRRKLLRPNGPNENTDTADYAMGPPKGSMVNGDQSQVLANATTPPLSPTQLNDWLEATTGFHALETKSLKWIMGGIRKNHITDTEDCDLYGVCQGINLLVQRAVAHVFNKMALKDSVTAAQAELDKLSPTYKECLTKYVELQRVLAALCHTCMTCNAVALARQGFVVNTPTNKTKIRDSLKPYQVVKTMQLDYCYNQAPDLEKLENATSEVVIATPFGFFLIKSRYQIHIECTANRARRKAIYTSQGRGLDGIPEEAQRECRPLYNHDDWLPSAEQRPITMRKSHCGFRFRQSVAYANLKIDEYPSLELPTKIVGQLSGKGADNLIKVQDEMRAEDRRANQSAIDVMKAEDEAEAAAGTGDVDDVADWVYEGKD